MTRENWEKIWGLLSGNRTQYRAATSSEGDDSGNSEEIRALLAGAGTNDLSNISSDGVDWKNSVKIWALLAANWTYDIPIVWSCENFCCSKIGRQIARKKKWRDLSKILNVSFAFFSTLTALQSKFNNHVQLVSRCRVHDHFRGRFGCVNGYLLVFQSITADTTGGRKLVLYFGVEWSRIWTYRWGPRHVVQNRNHAWPGMVSSSLSIHR